ncbi:hypothetical protein BRADI_1g73161v3 [Brachypodium distachyon]|uniref:BHLH domain-containing protein n=2 Tax=Brachypodium distachyon TaxID=15368 RepID=A0A2K2DUY4_BRADI|nr:hypothetical protein BRADI_1g73161v3 [Brachypodium distachyon]PNT78085.1 hypothetical protein BRADI_1g73161v3 [Brachypodium distachyon]PNT78086.1 hypothetical protein BRADI_1g73161v3 [Brachypodium distachyon]PNT78088.1 hypothetical protein BRADI_1g73161v3 [Brachypodium distachyon]
MGCGCQMIVVTSLHHGTAESDRLRSPGHEFSYCLGRQEMRAACMRYWPPSRLSHQHFFSCSKLPPHLQGQCTSSITLSTSASVPSSRVLQETCSYIRSLHREVDDLSERLSELLATSDMSSAQAAIIRSLLM